MEQAFMVVDLGTGNSRIAIVSHAGRILALARENTRIHTDHRFANAQYFVPQEWTETILRLAKEALDKAGDVCVTAITASSQREAIVLVGHDGEPVTGYTNADRRGQPYIQEMDWKRIWELTSLEALPILSAVKIVGAMRLEPEVLDKTAFYTSVSDWIGYLFTGVGVWERAQAIQSALYDPVAGDWSDELCGLFGVDKAKLPPLAGAGDVLGPVKPEYRQMLKLSDDAVFVVGSADTQIALAGMDVQAGETIIVSGTTSPCIKTLPEFRKYPRCWVSPTTVQGQFMLEVNTASSGVNLQRFRDQIVPGVSFAEQDADAVARGLPQTGMPRCLAVFLSGMHLDKDMLTGGFVMRNPFSIDMKPVDFLHALELNIAMSITTCIKRLHSLDASERDYLIGCGGGFTSPVIGQAVANLTGLPVQIYENFREATVHGCYLLCLQAAGKPVPARVLRKEIVPIPSPELDDYFAHWKSCREQFNEMDF